MKEINKILKNRLFHISRVIERNNSIEQSNLESFSDIKCLSENTIKTLSTNGFKNLYPIQKATFDHLLNENNLIARDRTGTGKTLAFTLPLIENLRKKNLFTKNKNPLILVITPTRELCIQVSEEIKKLSNY